jgi:hypothetical protein
MRWRTSGGGLSAGGPRCAMAATLAILLTGCGATTGAGDAGCVAYAEARLGRPPAASVAGLPPDWAGWIADIDDCMTGTCQ